MANQSALGERHSSGRGWVKKSIITTASILTVLLWLSYKYEIMARSSPCKEHKLSTLIIFSICLLDCGSL